MNARNRRRAAALEAQHTPPALSLQNLETDVHEVDSGSTGDSSSLLERPRPGGEIQAWLREVITSEAAVIIATDHIAQLYGSERGAAALSALSRLLWHDSTWSLDDANQLALSELLQLSLGNPAVRDLVQTEAPRR